MSGSDTREPRAARPRRARADAPATDRDGRGRRAVAPSREATPSRDRAGGVLSAPGSPDTAPAPDTVAATPDSAPTDSPTGAPNGAVRPVISVRDLHITYRVSLERKTTLKNTLVKRFRGQRQNYREVNALRGIDADIAHGKCTGVIGTNGAGKSTLMRAVAGILPPTSGRIDVYGKVSTLLALGVGFNSELTGRENVTLGGLASGRTRDQIRDQFDEIAGFADLGDFIDMPMRTYSSGMYSRLAFSVAVHMDPDILIIDEALSAGDASFKSKAKAKMMELIDHAGSMLLVSHSLSTIRDLSDEVLWLHKGQLVRRGDPREVTKAYAKFLDVGEDDTTAFEDF